MKYDPVKRSLGSFFNQSPVLRKFFYKLLDLLLLRSWHIRKELKELKKDNFNTGNILDAGSGFGQYVYRLSRLFPDSEITGLDIKEEQIVDCNQFFAKINKSDKVLFEIADLTKYRKDNYYDLILSVDVMEHIEDDISVFRNFAGSLRKGGVLLISTPSDQGGSDVHEDHEESFIEEHVRDGYGADEIREKLRKAGFDNIYVRYAYGKPGKISWSLSMKYPILLTNISKLFLILLPFYYILIYPVSYILNCLDVARDHKTGTGLIVKCIR